MNRHAFHWNEWLDRKYTLECLRIKGECDEIFRFGFKIFSYNLEYLRDKEHCDEHFDLVLNMNTHSILNALNRLSLSINFRMLITIDLILLTNPCFYYVDNTVKLEKIMYA